MGESIFLEEGEYFTPTAHARGPWDPGTLHGGAAAALIARAFTRMQPDLGLPFARLSFEFLRPVPMGPLALQTSVSRPGRRVQALAAELSADGRCVCRASALRILAVPGELPDVPPDERADQRLADPTRGREVRFALDDLDQESFAASATQMRFLSGGPVRQADGEQALSATGTATVWMRLRHPLLAGEPANPLSRLVAAADFANGVAAALPFERYLFINADLHICLDREPRGEWIALQAHTRLHPAGVGWAQSVLHDEAGPVGRASQALVVHRR